MSSELKDHAYHWDSYLNDCSSILNIIEAAEVSGRIIKLTGLVMEATGMKLSIGSACSIPLDDGTSVEAEVVGFDGAKLFLMPQKNIEGITPGCRVLAGDIGDTIEKPNAFNHKRTNKLDRTRHLPVGFELLGRVLDATGKPLDKLGPIYTKHQSSLSAPVINPLNRMPIERTLDVGVKAINSMLTVGRGQRLGLFAGSGVGKSMLLGMMARYTEADVIVVGLIGERGREVKEFIEQILGKEGLARSVVVAAPSDSPALMRLQGASYATTIAEYFRAEGKHVLLIMDSLTRYAMAQREIALAIGEPPATKGYPPSVFAKLPVLVERAGNGEDGGGSITAFYTVLTEGDDQQDPIADAARAILDGHIVLNRTLAESGHYPAIDIEQSISRAMHSITTAAHQKSANKLKQLNSKYSKSSDLINVGAYIPGGDLVLDEAVKKHERIAEFLQQGTHERMSIEESINELAVIVNT